MAISRRALILGGGASVVAGGGGLATGLNAGATEGQRYENMMSELAQVETLRTLSGSIPEESIVTVLNTFQAHKDNFKAMSPAQLKDWMSAQPTQEARPLPPASFAKRVESEPASSKDTQVG